MTEQPLVSVIINCYNGEKYLREAIDSVLAQTYENWELIFWDNQSTDSTHDIVLSYKNPQIRYYYAEEHTSLGQARNNAMKLVKGQYLSFLDADDLWLNDFLQTAIECLQNNKNLIGYYCNYYDLFLTSEKVHTPNSISTIKRISDILNYYNIGMSGVVLDNVFIKSNKIVFNNNYNLIEDLDFYTQISAKGELYYDSIPRIKYRCHPGSTTYLRAKEWHVEYERFLNNMKDVYLPAGIIKEKDLWRVKEASFGAKMDFYVQEDKKLSFIYLFFRNPRYMVSYWRNILFIFIGRDKFLIIKNRKKFNHN